MKKFLASLLVLSTMLCSVFAHSGTMSGEEDLRVTKTKWFDIIYPARSEQSAILLYENADRIYEEIGEMYGFAPKFRMPVVICPGVEQFNGYTATGLYNHIVLFDTAMIDELSVFTDTFLNLFKHECIHAYTFNLKNDTWTKIAKVLGDPMNFGPFVISSGMAEGATVSGESALGEGRLNNDYTIQMVKQAKIEGKFPDYFDVQGARDSYPSNSFYFFNGAFCEWLQKEYGMQKYARFWYHCCNFQNITQASAFKDVYDMKLKTAWKMFKSEYKVPEVPANPVKAEQTQDFFAPAKTKYSSKNNAGALYSQLTVSDKGLAYMDETSHKAYYISFDDIYAAQTSDTPKLKPKKLFTSSRMFEMSLSKDGRYLAHSVYDLRTANVRTITKIYDMDTGKFFEFEDHGYYEPAVVKSGNDYYVIRQGYEAPNYTIRVDKLSLDETGRITAATEVKKQTLPLNIAPFDFTDLGNGTFAYIRKTGIVYSIEVMDLQLNVVSKFELPKDRMVIRHLTNSGDKLMFSWTEPGTLPRLGTLSVADGTFELQQEDISGGVYYPVSLSGGDSIAYIGNFYLQNRLFLSETSRRWLSLSKPAETELSTPSETELPESSTPSEESPETIGIQPQSTELPYTPYKAFNYFKRGVIMPLSSLITTSYSPSFRGSYSLPIGVTYMTSDPWDSINLQLGAGYGLQTNSGGLDLIVSGKNGTGSFTYSAEAGTEFYPKGWKKVTASGNVAKQYPLGNGFIQGQIATQLNFGKSDTVFAETGDPIQDLLALISPGSVVSEDTNNYTMFNSGLLAGYSHINRSGPGRYENAGFKTYGSLYYTFWNNATKHDTYYNGLDVELYAVISAPKLIPIDCVRGITYNLPTKILIDLFPSSIQNGLIGAENYTWAGETFKASLPVASFDVETLVFGADIQKAALRYLFFNDIQLTAGYAGLFVEDESSYADFRLFHMGTYFNKIKAGEVHYEDYANVRLSIAVTPNFGQAFASFNNSIYFELGLAGLAGQHSSTKPIFTFGLSSSLF